MTKAAKEELGDLPLYPSEAQIARAVLGNRSKDWKHIATALEEKQGFPRVNEMMGGRFWPAVVAFFHQWQHISIDGTQVQHSPPRSRFHIVPPKHDRRA